MKQRSQNKQKAENNKDALGAVCNKGLIWLLNSMICPKKKQNLKHHNLLDKLRKNGKRLILYRLRRVNAVICMIHNTCTHLSTR